MSFYSGRSQDLKAMEEFANRNRPKGAPTLPLSEEEARQGVRMVEQLEESIALSETAMKALKELYAEHPLVQAILGAMGEEMTDLRSHLPRLLHEAEEAR